jgi:hypothetical protein
VRLSVALRLLPAAGAALVLAACGSGSGSRPPTAATPTTSASTTPASTTTAAAAAPTSSTASRATATAIPQGTAALASRGCRSGQIAVSTGASTAGLGHVGEPLRFENVGAAPCTLHGYPGVALIGSGGRELQLGRTPNGYLGGLSTSAKSDPVIRLRPHQTASALLEGEDSTASGQPCPRYEALLVTPPNLTATARVARPLSICDPQVHPVVGGTSGTQAP